MGVLLGEEWATREPDALHVPGFAEQALVDAQVEAEQREQQEIALLQQIADSLADLHSPPAPEVSPAVPPAVVDTSGLAAAITSSLAPLLTPQPQVDPTAALERLTKAIDKMDRRILAGAMGGSGGGTAVLSGSTHVDGTVANGAADLDNPVKIGGRYSASTPTPVADGQRVNAWYDQFGRPNTALHSAELNTNVGLTSLRDLQVAQRYTALADSIADGFAIFWTLTNGGSGTLPAVASGEGTLAPGTTSGSYSQMTSLAPRYFPGQSAWLNSAIRFGDTGVVGNTRRIGAFTVSGQTPQDGFYFELADTTFNAVVVKAGTVVSTTPAASWSRAAAAPFTLDANYHSFEIRWTANGVQFYADNVVRHVYAGSTSAITATLDFPMTLQTINTGTTLTSGVLAVRNIGIGRFGTPPSEYMSAEIRPDQAGANAVQTFTFSTPVDFIWVTDVGTTTTNVSRVDPYGGTPSSSAGIAVFNQTPTPIQVVPARASINVYAPTGSTITMYGLRYV